MSEKKSVTIEILLERCKECGTCMAFCPKDVLQAGDDGKPVIANLAACSGCKMCEYRCPDLAIKIEKGVESVG
jgi:2-oxoglutarate ferredoxin oxidoreductase subunit delta